MRVVAVIALVLTLVSWGAPRAQADDACAGMEAYEHDLLEASRAYGQWLIDERFRERDLATFSATEWREAAKHAEEMHTGLKAITPPKGVAEWHTLQIDASGLQSSFALSAANIGYLTAAMAMQEQFADIEDRREVTKTAAIDACPAFAEVYETWDALDQDPATPVASPTP